MKLVAIFMLLYFTSCSDTTSRSTTDIRFKMPAHPDANGAQSLTPSSGSLQVCYIVTVNGPGIESNSDACSISPGINTGFLAPLQDAELSVPKGDSRTVSLYAYLVSDSSQSCQSLSSDLRAERLKRVYKMGETTDVNLTEDAQSVAITAQFPGVRFPISRTDLKLASCFADPSADLAEATATSQSGVLTSQLFHMETELGFSQSDLMESSSFKLELDGIGRIQ